MRFIPMQLYPSESTVRQPNSGDTLQLPPSTSTISLAKIGEHPNCWARRDNLNTWWGTPRLTPGCRDDENDKKEAAAEERSPG